MFFLRYATRGERSTIKGYSPAQKSCVLLLSRFAIPNGKRNERERERERKRKSIESRSDVSEFDMISSEITCASQGMRLLSCDLDC
jgi:hypothetical protein